MWAELERSLVARLLRALASHALIVRFNMKPNKAFHSRERRHTLDARHLRLEA